jgi:hypothetical protein
MRFLSDRQGNETIEYIGLGAVLVVLALGTLWLIGQSSKTQGTAVSSYIDGINVTSAP